MADTDLSSVIFNIQPAMANHRGRRISYECPKTTWRRIQVSSTVITCRGGDSSTDFSNVHLEQYPKPKLLVEFDTDIASQNRFGSVQIPQGVVRPAGSTLSISLDASQCLHRSNATTILIQHPNRVHPTEEFLTSPSTSHIPLTTIWTLVSQSALLLPSLLITRRLLNSTSNAVVDYFRGRYLRTTFTRLERAYLRYYEFPAATRSMFRVSAQVGIFMSLSWIVRWWMWMVLKTGGEDVTLSTFIDATSSTIKLSWDFEDGCLPCHRVGRGVPWLCGVIWIASVVGTGHACAVALSKWGGPLRLQAASANQQTQKPTHVLSWIIHHPIKWLRGLDEWKHFSSLGHLGGNNKREGRRRWQEFNPDPLLFPATWMPLRWLQIYAIAKAFATNPDHFRWCSPEKQIHVVHRLMNLYLIQLALGDEWSRVFLGEYRVGLGIVVITCYFIGKLVQER